MALAPRLLTERDMAEYLSTPIAAVRRLAVGRVTVDGRVRFDRVAVDRWLDGRPTLDAADGAGLPANLNASPAEDALARFKQSRPDVARRAPG